MSIWSLRADIWSKWMDTRFLLPGTEFVQEDMLSRQRGTEFEQPDTLLRQPDTWC